MRVSTEANHSQVVIGNRCKDSARYAFTCLHMVAHYRNQIKAMLNLYVTDGFQFSNGFPVQSLRNRISGVIQCK